MRGIIHRGTGIDLDQPWTEVLINHEIVTKQLHRVLPTLHLVLCALHSQDNNLFHHGLYRIVEDILAHLVLRKMPKIYLKMISKLLLSPHVTFNVTLVEVLRVLCYRVVGEMNEPIYYTYIATYY